MNVSFAQLQLEDDLDFSDTIFGLGAGIFSLGYRTSDASWRARWPASGD